MYTSCTSLLTQSGGEYPGSSVFEINANGISLNKIVIGKPAIQGDSGSGYMSPSALSSCLVTAMNKGWSECSNSSMLLSVLIGCASIAGAGVMTWEVRTRIFFSFSRPVANMCAIKFPNAEATWISTVRAKAFA